MSGAKEDEVYIVPADDGVPGWALSGVFFRDTVYFDRWGWSIAGAQRLSRTMSGNTIGEHHALVAQDRSQLVELHRSVTVDGAGFVDRWDVANLSDESQSFVLALDLRARMVDLFALRTEAGLEEIVGNHMPDGSLHFSHTAADGVGNSAQLNSVDALPDDLVWTLSLGPRETKVVEIRLDLSSSDHAPDGSPVLGSYEDWRHSFGNVGEHGPQVRRAIDDLRALLLRTPFGPYPAAGLPVFVNFFGRDALIIGMMLLDWRPDVLRAVLAFLAAHQGKRVDPFREEEPGKILHEVRRGELSRTDRIPFGRYYGSVDSTPLFLMAAGAFAEAAHDPGFVASLRPAVEQAVDWLTRHLDGPSGLATFKASGSGLTVQSWKDSANSMVDEHGQPARQPLAVAEVQGYAFAALLASARLLPDRASELERRAAALREAFHRQFWMADLGTYAMALDADLRPLRVLSSDPGHLLWCGIVPADIAPTLVATLLGPALWSGWGVRTLGSGEVAYNPVSYHNGSVWPHDTALFAMGLARYGFTDELEQVARAMLDLAAASPRRQMPELISGYARTGDDDPIPYTHANVPQSWAAAAVVRMAAYLGDAG